MGAPHPSGAAGTPSDEDPDHDNAAPTHHDSARNHHHNHPASVHPAAAAVPAAAAFLSSEHDPAAGARAGPGAKHDAPGQLNFACQRIAPLHWRAVMITLDHVTKQYKSSARPALDDVNVKIDKGEFVFLIGPSGSGKSTFMRLLLAADTPTTGDIRVSKFHVNKLRGRHVPKLRQVIGCVFQDFRLLQQKTVYDNVAFALEVIGKRTDAINRVVPEVLETVGLSGKANRLPHELSGGEQQRVAIARAFVNRPLVLLADEPTGNLDPDTSKDIMDLLERINRTGTTVLMATHDHHIVDSMRQRVVELSLGRLVRDEQRGVYGMDR
ncbi:Cell division ATP-binding protein FtsE [Mycobacterium simulans]|uniref:Cell division ATP-binding protein FtsE n=3 Tax=Mycobacterium TaxID=1763 RepID=A0A7Z7N9M4_9MYCO|nr:Cell division ATP-binding protein FtsE [Mycobacterium simulans]